MPLWVFFFLAALAVLSALGVVLQRNPIHCLLALIGTLLVVAVLFVGMGAPTVGFLQAIVYAGAIMVLFLFVIWLLNLQYEPLRGGRLALKVFGALGAAALIAELLCFVLHLPSGLSQIHAVPAGYGGIDLLANNLFSAYLIAFEATSVLLLVGVVGAVALARRGPARPASGGSR